MEKGTFVTFYTHTGNDNTFSTVDEVALVLREANGAFDLAVFPVGGPVRFEHVWEYDPEDPYLTVGHSYVRPADADAPDFSQRFRYDREPEMAALINKQRVERADAPGNKREELRKQHQQQQAELFKRLDDKYKPEDAGADKPEPGSQPTPGGPKTPSPASEGRRA